MDYIMLIIGFILLIKGADVFVDGASKISKKLGIPSIIVGLTIVSLGTSAPELAVSVLSSIKGSNDMAVGNVLGSNIFNILMVLGATSLFTTTIIYKKDVKRDYLVALGSTILFTILTFTILIQGQVNVLSRLDGLVLLSLCVVYIFALVKSTLKSKKSLTEEENISEIKVFSNIVKILIGIAAIIYGGDWVVNSASAIGMSFGMSEKFVGLTIVAVGTSLPELVTSLVAAKKGENEIALGNVLGSCIFNILLIIGASSIISPITVASTLIIDFSFLIFILVLLGIMIFANKKESKRISKFEGLLLVSLYIGYIVFIIVNN